MNELTTIDPPTLDTVSGGEPGQNQSTYEGNVNVQTPALTVSGQGRVNTARTDYGLCMDTLAGRGVAPDKIPGLCAPALQNGGGRQ